MKRLLAFLAFLALCSSAAVQARGLAFDETMRGTGVWAGELRDVRFDFDVTIADIDAWRASTAHPASLAGTVRFDGGAPTALSGTLEILAPAPNDDGRVLVYRLQAGSLRFLGAKLVRDDGGFDLIDDVTTLHGVFLPPAAPWPTVASLVYGGQWSTEVQFEWWKPSVVLAFLDSFATIDTPWYERLWVKILFVETTFGAVAAEFFLDLF